MTRTRSGATFSLKTFRPDIPKPRRGPYRNPLIYARELQTEMLRGEALPAHVLPSNGNATLTYRVD